MKKIKLPLEMANGVQVRTLDELKENWDLEKVLNYYLNGKLQTWLIDRYYTELAGEVDALSGITDNAELQQKLCGIFGIEIKEDFVDVEAVAERNRRLEILRQYTADDAVLKNVDKVAFNQEELAYLLDEGNSKIYLFNNKFSIPLAISDKTYIGIGDVVAVINSKEYVDFAKLHISFDNICFNKEYEELANTSDAALYQKAEELEKAKDYKAAFEYYLKSAKLNNGQAYLKMGYFYENGLNVEQNYEKAYEFYNKAIDLGNIKAKCFLAGLYLNDYIKDPTAYKKAYELYKEAYESGNTFAGMNIGCMYYFGKGVNTDFKIAFEYLIKNDCEARACDILGWMYEFGQGTEKDLNKALEYYKRAADNGIYKTNYIYDPVYRYAYIKFVEFGKKDEAVKFINAMYDKDKLAYLTKTIKDKISNLKIKEVNFWSPGLSIELVNDCTSKSDAYDKLANKKQQELNKFISYLKNDVTESENKFIDEIRNIVLVKNLINEDSNVDIRDIENYIKNQISVITNSIEYPSAYELANSFGVDDEFSHGTFFSPNYSYSFSYHGNNLFKDLQQQFNFNMNEMVKNVQNMLR